jgi:hypothetical protein
MLFHRFLGVVFTILSFAFAWIALQFGFQYLCLTYSAIADNGHMGHMHGIVIR